jgi:CheY-like chemotaxis protein
MMPVRKKVLLVDDDEAVLALLSAKLSSHYDVLTSQEPHAVRDIVLAQQPDVVLCDIDMPAMTGGEVAAALAAEPGCARVPLIYLTALVSPEEAREMQGLVGGRPGVSKRAALAELVFRIEEVMAGAEAA